MAYIEVDDDDDDDDVYIHASHLQECAWKICAVLIVQKIMLKFRDVSNTQQGCEKKTLCRTKSRRHGQKSRRISYNPYISKERRGKLTNSEHNYRTTEFIFRRQK
jgi:hypothetical protein